MRIELHPEADAEFAAQIEHYEHEQQGLGKRFYHDVIASLEWIAVNPTVPRLRKTYRRFNLKVFPFFIAYVAERDLIRVLSVAHSRRKPEYWKKRIKQ